MTSSLLATRRAINDLVRSRAEVGILQVVRRSSRLQENNEASLLHQRKQTLHLARYGIQDLPIQTMELLESAKENIERESVEQILALMNARRIGVMLLSAGSRLTRSEVDGARLISAAAKNKVIFLVKGMVLDPRDPFQHAQLMEMIIAARMDNADRAYTVAAMGHDYAREKKMLVRLPTGFNWADPADETYRSMLAAADYADWMSEDQLKLHEVAVPHRGAMLYALPNPHPDVFDACRLVARWMLETGDPREVQHRIAHDPEYPRLRRGLFPTDRSFRFRPGSEPAWERIIPRRLEVWFKSWGLYGVYSYTSHVLQEFVDVEDPEFRLEGAFPALLHPRDRDEVLERIRISRSSYRAGGYTGPRNHVLPHIICMHPLPDGSPCRGRLYPTQMSGQPLKFMGYGPYHAGHATTCHRSVEDCVLGIIEEVFRPESVEAAIGEMRRQGAENPERRTHLAARVQELENEVRVSMEAEASARKRVPKGVEPDDDQDVKDWQKRRDEYREEQRRCQADLERLEANAADLRLATQAEYAQIRDLAGDVTALLAEARAVERRGEEHWKATGEVLERTVGLVRRIVGRLISGVELRNLARGVQYVEVLFRSGARAGRVHFSYPVKCTQPERVWIAFRTGEGWDAERVADEMNRLRGPKKGFGEWSPEKVETALWMHRCGPEPELPRGRYLTAAKLADQVGETEESVQRAMVREELGPIRLVQGEVAARPSARQLDAAFPEYARRRIAARRGWSDEETVSIMAPPPGIMCSRATLQHRAKHKQLEVATDLAGRRYARLQEVQTTDVGLDAALATAPEHLRRLDRRYWTTFQQAQERVPGVSRQSLKKAVGERILHQGREAFLYLDPETADELRHFSLAEAVAALGRPDLAVEDFYSPRELVSVLRAQFGCGSATALTNGALAGHLHKVYAWIKGRGQPRRIFIYLPPDVASSQSTEDLHRWLRGEHPSWPGTCGCGSWPCARLKGSAEAAEDALMEQAQYEAPSAAAAEQRTAGGPDQLHCLAHRQTGELP